MNRMLILSRGDSQAGKDRTVNTEKPGMLATHEYSRSREL